MEKIAGYNAEMNVQVLTCGYWPTYPVVDAQLPEEVAQCQEVFKDFYLQKHHGRRLQWYNYLGTCMLKAKFKSGTKEIQVSFFQVYFFNPKHDITKWIP